MKNYFINLGYLLLSHDIYDSQNQQGKSETIFSAS